MDAKSRDELLVRIDERTKKLEEWMSQHITYHNRATIAFVGSLIAVVISLLAMLI
jgi:LEA14-like dessication related protein